MGPEIADGSDTRFLFSVGSFFIGPGETFRLLYAVVIGENVHVDPTDFADYYQSDAPQAYYDRLDFSGLIANAHIAQDIADHLDCRHNGEANGDGLTNPVDVVYLISYVLMGGPAPRSDTFCPSPNRGDFNCDGLVNLVDIVGLINYVFRQPAPGPCGN